MKKKYGVKYYFGNTLFSSLSLTEVKTSTNTKIASKDNIFSWINKYIMHFSILIKRFDYKNDSIEQRRGKCVFGGISIKRQFK